MSFFQAVVSPSSETQDDGKAPAACRRGPDSATCRHHHQPVPSFIRGLQRAVQGKPCTVQLRLQRRAASEASWPQTDRERETLTVAVCTGTPHDTHQDTTRHTLVCFMSLRSSCSVESRRYSGWEVRGCSVFSSIFSIKQRLEHYTVIKCTFDLQHDHTKPL